MINHFSLKKLQNFISYIQPINKKFNLALESDDKLDYNESANIKDFIEIFNLHQNLAFKIIK